MILPCFTDALVKVGAALALPLLFFADALSPVDYLPPLYGIVALVAAAVGGRMFGTGPYLHSYFRVRPFIQCVCAHLYGPIAAAAGLEHGRVADRQAARAPRRDRA